MDGDCSHEIKRRLLLGRKAVTNLDSMLKSKEGLINAKNSMDLTEVEDTKKKWQEYTEELYKKRSSRPR